MPNNPLHDLLRDRVSGAIDRGEGHAVRAIEQYEGKPMRESDEVTPAAGVYQVTVETPDVIHRFSVTAADAADAENYVRLVCVPAHYPGAAYVVTGVRLVRASPVG